MFVRLCLEENTLYADEGSIGHPDPHPFFQIGVRSWGNPALHQDLDAVNLFVRNGRWPSFVAEDPNYAFGLQYIKPRIVIHESVDEEIAWKKGEKYPLSAILSATPTFD